MLAQEPFCSLDLGTNLRVLQTEKAQREEESVQSVAWHSTESGGWKTSG